jgi:hypothetical protein
MVPRLCHVMRCGSLMRRTEAQSDETLTKHYSVLHVSPMHIHKINKRSLLSLEMKRNALKTRNNTVFKHALYLTVHLIKSTKLSSSKKLMSTLMHYRGSVILIIIEQKDRLRIYRQNSLVSPSRLLNNFLKFVLHAAQTRTGTPFSEKRKWQA